MNNRSHQACVVVLVAMILPPAATGQDSDEARLEEILVTGSRIPRRDFGAPSPITTVDRETLVNSGQPTLEESLNQMPQITPDFVAKPLSFSQALGSTT